MQTIKARGASLKATEQPIDTSTAAGKAFFDMLGVFAEFETNLRKERQLEGIAAAKEKGVYTGRKPSIDTARVRQLASAGTGASAIAKELKISRASVYRLLEEDARDAAVVARRKRNSNDRASVEAAHDATARSHEAWSARVEAERSELKAPTEPRVILEN